MYFFKAPSQAQTITKQFKPILCTNNSDYSYKGVFNTEKLISLLKAFVFLLIVTLFFISLPFGNAKAAQGVEINATNFPDANFRTYVEANCKFKNSAGIYPQNTAGDHYVETETHEIYVASKNISSLEGIEYFTNLILLECQNNLLTTLDVSANTALTSLYCGGNLLTTLDASANIALTTLSCERNLLTTLDFSGVTTLVTLNCFNNHLVEINVSANKSLTSLSCGSNELRLLIVSYNTALTSLKCYHNKLTTLDVSANGSLEVLSCFDNQLPTLDVSANDLLEVLSCYHNELITLDVSANKLLTWLDCSVNQLTTLDFSGNTALTSLSCGDNQLTTLNVSSTVLTSLSCDNNQLTTLNVSSTVLTYLSCNRNQITTLDVLNTALIDLRCSMNQLTALDVSGIGTLDKLYCYNNQLTTLNVSNTALMYLHCNDNQLTALDVSGIGTLEKLYCYNNQLTMLNFSNTALTYLSCYGNQLTTLNVSNTALMYLYCNSNQLTSLDLTNNTALFRVNMYSQYPDPLEYTYENGNFYVDLKELPYANLIDMNRISMTDGGALNTSTGIVGYTSLPTQITYNYDTRNSGAGEDILTVRITTKLKPITIFNQPANKTVVYLNTATFSVTASGNDPLLYQWYINSGNGWAQLSGAKSNSYTTQTTTLENDGYRYYCKTTDAFSASLNSQTAVLTVVMPPKTGDNSPIDWLIALAIISTIGLVGIVFNYARRKKYKKL